ncbi:GerMN domain-containing protein [Phycicoccus jejuensis]|uniref:GerMN domain-containing protein n=1 Tax=Phycicoccus jejuensis TaxID=367299 RepID=UPI00384D9D04
MTGRRRAALLLTAAVLLAGCGAPRSSPATTLESVPYDLLAPSQAPEPSPTEADRGGGRAFLVRGDALVPTSPVSPGSSTADTVRRTLARLTAGPTEDDRAAGRSSALGPDVPVSLVALSGRRAVVDIGTKDLPPGAGRLTLAVGQLVLTVTSVPGVDEVTLTSGGQPLAAPVPGGALVDRPLTAEDYRSVTSATTR